MTVLSNNMINLKTLIEKDVYKIPTYQRGYSWDKSQLEDFWEDLVVLYEDQDMAKHFIGLIVVHNGKNIIDVQQRISTAVILLDSIRDVLLNIYKEDLSIEDANNYDKALMESFYTTIKRELIHDANFTSIEQAQLEIFKCITTLKDYTLLLDFYLPESLKL